MIETNNDVTKASRRTDERGFAVPLAILVIVALGLVGGAAAFMSAGDMNVATLYAVANQTSDAAGAGLEHAVAKYDDRVAAYSSGDYQDFILGGGWPLSASLDNYGYTVDVKRDSFDFDGDGDLEPVSCKPNEDQNNGKGNNGNGNGNGNGNDDDDDGDDVEDGTDIGEAPGGDSGDYWEDPSGNDKNGDGQTGLSGGHYDVDVFEAGNKRLYHQHEFDDKYDTTKTELVDDPHLLWEDLLGSTTGNVTVSFNNENNAPGWHRVDLVNGTRHETYNKDAAPLTVNAQQISAFRIQYTNLTGFSCTNPGAVKSDAVSRAAAFTIYIHDESTGALLYEFAVYWHNKSDDCVPEDDGDVENPDKGDTKDTTDLNEDDEKAQKYCEEWAKKYADYEKKMAEAEELKAKAEAKDAEGKKSDGEWKKYYKKLEEAQKKYDESVVKCDLAHDYGSCDCSTEQTDTGSDDGSEDDGGGGNTTTVGPCILNGDDDGEPVFLFTSMATRGAFQASQRLVATTNANRSKVWRIAWLAD